MSAKRIYVFGEIHNNTGNVKHIESRIEQIKPEYLLHELLYEDRCYTKSVIEHRLDSCKDGGICDPRINKDIYKLGLKLGMKLVGIDLDDVGLSKLSVAEQFKKRESHMARLIKRHMEMQDKPTMVIVVGDTHLRQVGNKDLPHASPLIALFDNKDTVLERAPKNLQEVP